ncbi:SAM-dependent methyltransferase [Saccharothrix sp. NRRL B-16348]|uniref:SAM-dependent methyltransferase n=1 Tax=Saccharothrix sp. NRRL B-16348 TaxID=1415542 RepID=UPI0006ADCE17|nr:class I SAM-dependent methyltransferase [Saccharothrix sp. NRRL B-16348]KOX20721.1 SAM-dependent methyltransferase [Saccharothrix sp. NRRL B-16348]
MDATEEYWETFYRDRDQVWTGKANELLVREVAHLTPGSALDLGCGEGGDALWLAEQGWRVTAVDVSTVALARGAARATELGLAARVDWQRHDLARSFPTGVFDLVSAQFLHSSVAVEGEREGILARAAEAVAPGGRLLVVGHAGWPTWLQHNPPVDYRFPTNADVLASLRLGPEWVVEVDESVEREITSPEGEPGTRADVVLRLRRG